MEVLVPLTAFLCLLVIADGLMRVVAYVRWRLLIRRRLATFVRH